MIVRSIFLLALLVALFVLGSAAKCHPPDTRVVVFLQGLYTNYQSDGTQGTALEEHRFDTLKAAFLANGYDETELLDFSYAGGSVDSDGNWRPLPYPCALTDRHSDVALGKLEQMLMSYKQAHPEAHFALVGHSLGGYLAFLEGVRETARPDDAKLDVHVVVTLDSPLQGASADKKVILDQVPCQKTFQAGGELVTQKADPATPDLRSVQALAMAEQGIRLATFGNDNDCLWRTARCIGGDWVDDGATQYVVGAALTASYDVVSGPLESHDAILAHPPAVADAAAFVGAP